MSNEDLRPKATPSLNLPKSDATVEVSIINTTTDIVVPAWAFVQPILKGHETMNMPTFAFLIKNVKLGKSIMFDLGCRKDWWNFAPAAYNSIQNGIPGLNIPKNINEILEEGKEDVGKIDGIVWSHWHWDHTGDPSLFPKTAEVIVGPGFKEAFLPGYPGKKDSPMLEADFEGRNVREIEFDKSNKIGQYPSYDLFGDGSFYILDVPGHAIGHISGLARTTPDTFVFMGGDVCHFGGSYRPTQYAPMPTEIPTSVPLDPRFNTPCPCSIFTACHRDPENARTSPFYKVTQAPGGWYVDPKVAQQSVDRLEEFDADENVFVCVAHDGGLIPVVDWFPNGTLNEWKAKGWKEKSKWGFLNELPVDGKPGRPLLAPGLVKEGKVIEKVDRLGPVAGQA
ncbi:MAG: hypothetical protein LQ352_008214 [Teloschistes flavicans]|nr:MAG: hypothetical protein LQ352_008214 [Teloschistes flavicans]